MERNTTRASVEDLLTFYGEYLQKKHPTNFARYQAIRRTSRESALAEAVVFQVLDQLELNPRVNDTVQTGGADFLCDGSYRSPILRLQQVSRPEDQFVVEVTSMDLDAITRRSGIPKDIGDGQGDAFSLLTRSVFNKAVDKAPQLAGYDIPGVLAIASDHDGIAALFNSATVEQCLVSERQIVTPVGGGPTTESTDLRNSVFFRRGEKGHNIESCRRSISAILLIGVHGDHSCVWGILHPDPVRPLNIRLLPDIPFVRVANWPIAGDSIQTEWVIGDPEGREFRYRRIAAPESTLGSPVRDETIAEIVRRLVDHFRPERIYLFGSVARGDSTEDSDLDFLVVVPDDSPRAVVRGERVHEMLTGIPHPVDVIPWRKSDFEGRAAHVAASLPATVIREGKLVYDRRRVAA